MVTSPRLRVLSSPIQRRIEIEQGGRESVIVESLQSIKIVLDPTKKDRVGPFVVSKQLVVNVGLPVSLYFRLTSDASDILILLRTARNDD